MLKKVFIWVICLTISYFAIMGLNNLVVSIIENNKETKYCESLYDWWRL